MHACMREVRGRINHGFIALHARVEESCPRSGSSSRMEVEGNWRFSGIYCEG